MSYSVNEALREQQTLRTPVALFAEEYDTRSVRDRFTHLIPLSKPTPGEQYGFEVNLDACTGCKACVAACHSLNGLDDNESWRDVGLLVGLKKQSYVQTVTTACHHCEDPACSNGCPVLAYDKDAVTGIVRHLDDQCIGCSYCILKCPYDVPKFNLKRGIVRKCDMCHGRLAEGEAPACVQACPNEAIKIKVVKLSEVPDRGQIIAGAFDSSYTRPTTTYTSSKPVPRTAKPADEGQLRLDHAHPPLTWMLVLTQMSAGTFLINALAVWAGYFTAAETRVTLLTALTVGVAGIALSVLHLGQPLKAWRAFLGWRKSWLSREIIAFGMFAKLGALSLLFPSKLTLSLVTLAGVLAVFTSVMVYLDTRRPFWSMKLTSGKFFGTMLLLGTGLCAFVWCSWTTYLCAAGLGWMVALRESSDFWRALEDEDSAWHKSALVMRRRCYSLIELRMMLLVFAALVMPTLVCAGASMRWMACLSLLMNLASQLIERHHFFTACHGPKMPGN